MLNLIYPNWDAPTNIKAFSTTREGGSSLTPFDSLNLGEHVGDDPEKVATNRSLLPVPGQPCWLQQVHGFDTIKYLPGDTPPLADGCYTDESGQVCVVMTADCLPLLLTDTSGSFVAALHCGWRSVAGGIIERFLSSRDNLHQIVAWTGPAIGPGAFEVGLDVAEAFSRWPEAFTARQDDKFMADLPAIVSAILHNLGVNRVYHSNLCTYSQPKQFFSYRRDGVTGRMATAIWIE